MKRKAFIVVVTEEFFEKEINEKFEEIERLGLNIVDIKFSSTIDNNSYKQRAKLSALIICS